MPDSYWIGTAISRETKWPTSASRPRRKLAIAMVLIRESNSAGGSRTVTRGSGVLERHAKHPRPYPTSSESTHLGRLAQPAVAVRIRITM